MSPISLPPSTLPPRPAPPAGAGSLPASVKVLTFGWELAPILSGGLGVACAGLCRALVEEGAEITFVLPKVPRPIEPEGVSLLNARDVLGAEARMALCPEEAEPTCRDIVGLTTVPFQTPLAPYQGPAAYREVLASAVCAGGGAVSADRRGPGFDAASAVAAAAGPASSDSLYGGDLAAEVERLAAAASRIAADVPHDVIHCHDWMTFAAGIAARRVSGKPLVLHVHSTESDRSGGGFGNAEIRAREDAGLLAADRVVAVSDFTRRKILEQYVVDADKLRVVHNGIEAPEVGADAPGLPALAGRRPIVLFLGRLTAQKGPEWFLRAAERVRLVRPDTLFIVAGNGELLPWMIETAAEKGLAANMLFPGFLSGDDIARAYAMADVFVMPSVSEPFGLVPMEAMLRGTPAIVSRQSGVSEVIRHCLKVDFWDSDDVADKILGVLGHASLAAALATAGRREALGLGWQGPARRLLEVFAEVSLPRGENR